MNKRSSSRITKKEQERKIEEEERKREEELEEERQKKRDEEEARNRLKENYNKRSKMARDTRHKEMMEKQLLGEVGRNLELYTTRCLTRNTSLFFKKIFHSKRTIIFSSIVF